MTAPDNGEPRENQPYNYQEKEGASPGGKALPDVRAMLGTDEMKERLKKRRKSKRVLIVNLVAVVGMAVLVAALLYTGSGDKITDEKIEEDAFVAKKTLEIVNELEQEYFRRHGLYANEKALASEFPILKTHLDNLAAHNRKLEIIVEAESFTLSARPTDANPRCPARDITSRKR